MKETANKDLESWGENDLIELIKEFKSTNQVDADKAFSILLNRHAKVLVFLLKTRMFWHHPDGQRLAEEAIHTAFIKFYKNPDKCPELDRSGPDIHFRNWVVAMARNQVLSELTDAEQRKESEAIFHERAADSEPYFPSELKEELLPIIKEFFDSLNPKQQDILTTYWTYKSETTDKLPTNVLQNLAKQYNTLPDSIRQIEYRLRKRLEAKLGITNPKKESLE